MQAGTRSPHGVLAGLLTTRTQTGTRSVRQKRATDVASLGSGAQGFARLDQVLPEGRVQSGDLGGEVFRPVIGDSD
jgi:hypothetical protein